jgi:hypothetical protein
VWQAFCLQAGFQPNAPSFSRFWAIAQIVGRTPSSAADPLVGFSMVAADPLVGFSMVAADPLVGFSMVAAD